MKRQLASTLIAVAAALTGCARAAADPAIVDLLPDKARYAPGEVVTLTARVQGDQPTMASVDLSVYQLDAVVHAERKGVEVRKDDTSEVTFQCPPPAADFTGYLAVAQVEDSTVSTGVDVSSSSFRYPRYGYVSEFDPALSAQERDRRVERLSRNDRREQQVDVFQVSRADFRWFAGVCRFLHFGSIEQTVPSPDLRWHIQLALDDRDHPPAIDRELAILRQNPTDRTAAVIADFEASVVQAEDQTIKAA